MNLEQFREQVLATRKETTMSAVSAILQATEKKVGSN